ncbi:hypothetical protein SLEP1_g17199 [Rubroshorea leprosula]|uniref:Transposase (putative) gypsy type domain-containing protein n=1 Tax=Rubroshorea leprosula TaxID=152421 RepID=A0AAV5J2K0_9ROSI|nr:hypothetical protein SLEP1_g17199 [Rubroshorea leprosula]
MSNDSPTVETPSETEGGEEAGCSALVMSIAAEVVVFEGWESKVLSGRLDNLRKAPKTLPVGFRFRAALHHEVVDGAATIKGYKKLEEMVRRYHIPRTVLIRAGTPNKRYELALTQLTPNNIKFIIGFMLLCERLGMPAKAAVFRLLFLCCLCPSTSGTRWYYISRREKMMIFTNIRNKVARWKRQFVFIRDTRTERINNELAARLSEWRTPTTYMNYPQLTSGDINLKNRLLEHVKAGVLVDLETLVIPDQIALLGFVDVANLHGEAFWRGSASEHKAQGAGELGQVPSVNPGLTSGHLLHRGAAHSIEVPARHRGHMSSIELSLRPPAPEGAQGRTLTQRMTFHSSGGGRVPACSPPQRLLHDLPACPKCQTECQTAMLQGMQNFVPPADRLRAKGHIQQHRGHAALIKLMDAFSYTVALFECEQGSSEMANRAASAESRADELARKVDELKEELQRAQVEKDTSIQAAKEELGRAEERARKTKLHQRDVCFARAQGVEWLMGAEMLQDAVAVAPANTTTDIFNEVRGRVLHVRADFPIGELAFFEGEEIDNERKSLAPPVDTRVADPHDVPAKPSSTPPSAQPHPQLASATVPAPLDRSSPARSVSALNDASIPVDLTDD